VKRQKTEIYAITEQGNTIVDVCSMLFGLLGSAAVGATTRHREPVDYVSPNIGGIGQLLTATVPYVQTPHGMARLAQITTPGINDRYLADMIYGFPAGPAMLMASIGEVSTQPKNYASTFDHGLHYVFRPLSTTAVNHRIIGIAGKRTVWIGSLHPSVERIMHEQIHQDRTDHFALRGAAFPRQLFPFSSLERRNQPPFDIQQYPIVPDMGAHSLQKEAMIDLIEGCFDVKLDHPVILPAALSGDSSMTVLPIVPADIHRNLDETSDRVSTR
jgi:hypothetical protein